jgi:TolA-binding protein
MNCEEVERKDILAAYITGKLPEVDRDQFEEHFFGCDECLQQVEAARIAREVLMARAAAKPKAAVRWWIPALAAAALLVVGIAVWKPAAPKALVVVAPQEKPSYDLLARFDPPAYLPSTLRSASRTTKNFSEAMKLYTSGDFAGAAKGLRGLDGSRPLYYLGVSELLSGDRSGGIADLQKVVALGDTPYLSEARFYLAKGLIGDGNLAGARTQLETLVQEKSELAPKASEILNSLAK